MFVLVILDVSPAANPARVCLCVYVAASGRSRAQQRRGWELIGKAGNEEAARANTNRSPSRCNSQTHTALFASRIKCRLMLMQL